MLRDDKIYIAGHRGLVGSALMRRLKQAGYQNLITRTHAELDLADQAAVNRFFAEERPQFVFLAAAKVGGIHANNIYPAEFIYQNLAIQINVIHAAHRQQVEKLLFLGSSCIYPRLAPQPMKEEYLLTGLLEPTNEPYAIAKIAGIKLCASYARQYGDNFFAVMPTNLYGIADSYHPDNAHVIPSLILKFHEAKRCGDSKTTVWGTGMARREFLFSEDMADACITLMEKFSATEIGEFINIGTGEDMTIAELASLIADVVGFKGKIVFDRTKPDGAPQKLLDVSRIRDLGWQPRVSLRQGLQIAYEDFVSPSASSNLV